MEKQVKRQLLGTPKVDSSEGFVPNVQRLTQPLENSVSIMWAFCSNCGTYSELSARDINSVKEKFNLTEVASEIDGSDQYMHKDSCPVCVKDISLIEIRSISSIGELLSR